jgi:DNA polymerase III epsilon subunit-like protein
MILKLEECLISVDVETAGPDPGSHAMLSIGACLVSDPEQGFYVELMPLTMEADEGAVAVSGLSMQELAAKGTQPAQAMQRFDAWLAGVTPAGAHPIFVAFNAAFDWMFINHYFHRFLNRNPFGHAALDMKSFFMGLAGVAWAETAMHFAARRYDCAIHLSHHALEDARDQAYLFQKMLREAVELNAGRQRNDNL